MADVDEGEQPVGLPDVTSSLGFEDLVIAGGVLAFVAIPVAWLLARIVRVVRGERPGTAAGGRRH